MTNNEKLRTITIKLVITLIGLIPVFVLYRLNNGVAIELANTVLIFLLWILLI